MYVELHALSNFSFLRGASQPEELVAQAKALNYAGLALTDECSLAGVVRAHIAAKEHGLPLIIGSELNCSRRPQGACRARARMARVDSNRGAGHRSGELRRIEPLDQQSPPCHPQRLLLADAHGSRERASRMLGHLAAACMDKAALPRQEQDGRWLRERFAGRLWIGVELTTCGFDARRLELLDTLGKTLQLPCVAAGDVHMHRRSRRALQDVLTAIRLRCPCMPQATPCIPMASAVCAPCSACSELYPARAAGANTGNRRALHFQTR